MSFLSSIVLFRDFYGTNLELFNFRSGHEGGGGGGGHCSFLLHGHGPRLKELFFKVCKTALIAEKAIEIILCQGVSPISSKHYITITQLYDWNCASMKN